MRVLRATLFFNPVLVKMFFPANKHLKRQGARPSNVTCGYDRSSTSLRCGECRGKSRRLSGMPFTLIELLVVAAILVMLVALLLPALKGAMDSVHRIECLNNLKQMGVGIHLYAQDWNDYIPPSGASPEGALWYVELVTRGGYLPPQDQTTIWFCPKSNLTGVSQNYAISYYLHGRKLTNVRSPGNIMLVGEPSTTVAYMAASQVPDVPGLLRHFSQMNALFVDGHSASVTCTFANNNNNWGQ